MKPIKRLSCPTCKNRLDTTEIKKAHKCPKDGAAMVLSEQWYVRATVAGKREYIPCGLLKRDADDYIAAHRIARRTGSILPGQEKDIYWEEGLKEFDNAEMRQSTRDYYKYVLAGLSKEFAGINLIDLTPERLLEYSQKRKTQGCAARTVAGDIGAVKRMFTLVTRHKSAKQYPRLHETMLDIQKVEKPSVDNYKDSYFSSEEIKRMIASSTETLALSIRLQIETGLRPGNVYSLKFSDISEDGTVTLPAARMKNGKQFVTTISRDLLHSIRLYALKWGIREHLFPSETASGHVHDMRSAWETMCKKAEVTGTPHKLRHSFASILLANDVPIVVVSDLLGHADIGITKKRYGHLEHAKKRDVLAEYRNKLAL